MTDYIADRDLTCTLKQSPLTVIGKHTATKKPCLFQNNTARDRG